MKSVCFGLIFVFFCTDQTPATVSDFCRQTAAEVTKFKTLTRAEFDTQPRKVREAELSLVRKHAKLCH